MFNVPLNDFQARLEIIRESFLSRHSSLEHPGHNQRFSPGIGIHLVRDLDRVSL